MLSGFISWLLSQDNYHWTCFGCSVYTCMVVSHVFKLITLLGICNSVNCFFIQKYSELKSIHFHFVSNFATFQSTNLYVFKFVDWKVAKLLFLTHPICKNKFFIHHPSSATFGSFFIAFFSIKYCYW